MDVIVPLLLHSVSDDATRGADSRRPVGDL